MQSKGTNAFATLEQLKSKVWDTRDEGVKELKKAGFRDTSKTYRMAETEAGRWYIEELDPHASQDVPDPVIEQPGKAKAKPKAKATTGKPATAPAPAMKAAAPFDAAVGFDKPGKAAAKQPARVKKAGKSSDPSDAELPPGFDDWLVAEGSKEAGILRTVINTKLGTERRWMPHLMALGKARGYTATMTKEGRFTRFFLKKI